MAEQEEQTSRFELKDYKAIRTHRMLRERVRTLLQPKIRIKTTNNITSSCIVIGQDTKNFSVDVKENRLALYDQSTYAQCAFDCIYSEPKAIWPSIQQRRNHQSNLLVVYFQQSSLTRNVFLNEYQASKFLKSDEKPAAVESEFGMLERAISSILQSIDAAEGQQLLISALGVTGSNIVDLLNLEQSGGGTSRQAIKRVRVKKDGRNVQAQNLSQIAVDSMDSLMNVLVLANYLKKFHTEGTGQRMEAQIYQLSIGRMSKQRDQIEQILHKLNFVRLWQQSLVMASLACCLKEITDGFTKVSARSNKLTFFLEDCLNRNSEIHLIYAIDMEESLKAQVNMLSFGNCINRPITLRKNYIGDKWTISRLRQYGNELTLQNLHTMDSRDRNQRTIRQAKLGKKYDVRVNRSLLSETTSSLHKRRSITRTSHEKVQLERIMLPPAADTAHSRLSDRAKYAHLKKIYHNF